LLLISMVTLSTALSVGAIMVIPVSGGLCYGHTKCALRKIKYSLVANSTLWLEKQALCCTLWNIEHTFSL